MITESQPMAKIQRAIVVGDGLVIQRNPARRAQLVHQAKVNGLSLEQMVTGYIEDGLESDLNCGTVAILAAATQTTDPVERKKQRLFCRYFDGKIKLAQFKRLAAEIDGGEWAVPLYS